MIKVISVEDQLDLTSDFLGSFFKKDFISFFEIRLLGLRLCDFCHFLFYGIMIISYLRLVELTSVESGFFLYFFNQFFFNLVIHYLIYLKVDLHLFIRILL